LNEKIIVDENMANDKKKAIHGDNAPNHFEPSK